MRYIQIQKAHKSEAAVKLSILLLDQSLGTIKVPAPDYQANALRCILFKAYTVALLGFSR
jgi:hypothetical protein